MLIFGIRCSEVEELSTRSSSATSDQVGPYQVHVDSTGIVKENRQMAIKALRVQILLAPHRRRSKGKRWQIY